MYSLTNIPEIDNIIYSYVAHMNYNNVVTEFKNVVSNFIDYKIFINVYFHNYIIYTKLDILLDFINCNDYLILIKSKKKTVFPFTVIGRRISADEYYKELKKELNINIRILRLFHDLIQQSL
jgi:hypothetical protein